MRIPALVGLAVVVALAVAGVAVPGGRTSHAVGFVTSVQVDTNVSGNTATSVGTVQGCNTIPLGQTLVIDVVVFSNVAVNNPGIGGYNFELTYNNTVLRVTGHEYQTMLVGSAAGASLISLGDNVPHNDGTFIVGVADFGPNAEGGNGILSRITLEAIGPGTSPLTLSGTTVAGNEGEDLHAGNFSVANGSVVVSGTCGGATPSPSPTPTPTPTAIPSPSPTPTSTPTTTPTTTQSPTPTAGQTGGPTNSPTPTATTQPSNSPGVTNTPTPTATPVPTLPGETPTPAPSAIQPGQTSTPTPTEMPTVKGDGDCDGTVDTQDAVAILLHLGAGDSVPCSSAADVNCDGSITTADLQAILKWRGGLPVSGFAACPPIASA